MGCDVGEVTEMLENEQSREGLEKGWRMICNVGEAT